MSAKRTHLNLEFGQAGNGNCLQCGGELLLVLAPARWTVHGPDEREEGIDDVVVEEEVGGNYCPTCNCLASLFLNTLELPPGRER